MDASEAEGKVLRHTRREVWPNILDSKEIGVSERRQGRASPMLRFGRSVHRTAATEGRDKVESRLGPGS